MSKSATTPLTAEKSTVNIVKATQQISLAELDALEKLEEIDKFKQIEHINEYEQLKVIAVEKLSMPLSDGIVVEPPSEA